MCPSSRSRASSTSARSAAVHGAVAPRGRSPSCSSRSSTRRRAPRAARGRQEVAHERGRRHRGPHGVERAADHRIGLDRPRDAARGRLRACPWRRCTKLTSRVRSAARPNVVRHVTRDLLGDEPVRPRRPSTDRACGADAHDDRSLERASSLRERAGDHGRHAGVALHVLRPDRLVATHAHVGHEVGDRHLHHRFLAERRAAPARCTRGTRGSARRTSTSARASSGWL